MANPSGITFQAEYEPDEKQMVKALRILKEAPEPKVDESSKEEKIQEGA